jgi:hypothetical protein
MPPAGRAPRNTEARQRHRSPFALRRTSTLATRTELAFRAELSTDGDERLELVRAW